MEVNAQTLVIFIRAASSVIINLNYSSCSLVNDYKKIKVILCHKSNVLEILREAQGEGLQWEKQAWEGKPLAMEEDRERQGAGVKSKLKELKEGSHEGVIKPELISANDN